MFRRMEGMIHRQKDPSRKDPERRDTSPDAAIYQYNDGDQQAGVVASFSGAKIFKYETDDFLCDYVQSEFSRNLAKSRTFYSIQA